MPNPPKRKRPKKVNSDYDDYQFWVQYGIDIENRIVHLDEDVDDAAVGWIIRAVLYMDAQSDELIKVYLNTYGGSMYDGFALYDVLRSCNAPIHTYALGKVMSMGTIIMLAGDRKLAYPHATFMWHSASMESSDGKVFDLQDNIKELERLYDRLIKTYVLHTDMKKQWWRNWLRYKDQYGDVDKAKELGFVDEVVKYGKK